MKKYNDDLAVNPIKFSAMGHNGYIGEKGDTNDMFDTQLKQNIAFACYYETLTAEEIARKINVPVTYVADELKILCEYGYIDRMDNTKNPKFRTNMFITDNRLLIILKVQCSNRLQNLCVTAFIRRYLKTLIFRVTTGVFHATEMIRISRNIPLQCFVQILLIQNMTTIIGILITSLRSSVLTEVVLLLTQVYPRTTAL